MCHSDEYKPFTTEENKSNLGTREKDDTVFNNCSICLLWFAAKSESLLVRLSGLQAICYRLLISQRYSFELQAPVKKGTLRCGSRVAITAWRPMQATLHFREEQASALFQLHCLQYPRYSFTFPLHCSLELVWVSLHQWFSNCDLWIPMDYF